MDRLRNLALLLLLFCSGCPEPERQTAAPSRFAAVKSTKNKAVSFCEKTYPAGARRFVAPKDRPLPMTPKRAVKPAAKPKWIWINLWASWCGPCLKEMPLLEEWRRSLGKEGVTVRFELWSVDEDQEAFKGTLGRAFPGVVRWMKTPDDLEGLLASMGVGQDSALPVHALVDSKGMLRCVRVGSVKEEAYGQVKTLLSGGLE